MTAALNPVTGCGMSSTEIAAEPPPPTPPVLRHPTPPPHRTVAVCVTTPREAGTTTHTHTPEYARTHTGSLCVPQDGDGDGVKLGV